MLSALATGLLLIAVALRATLPADASDGCPAATS